MRFPKVRVCILVVIFFGLTDSIDAQSGELKPDRPNLRGELVDGRYSNSFFGFEMELPKGWVSLDQGEIQTATNMTAESLRSKNPNANQAIEKAYSLDTPLFLLAKNPLGSIENASIGINAVKQPSQHITARMVLEATKSAYLKNPKTKLVEDTKSEIIAGKTFLSIEFDIEMIGQRSPLRLYLIILKGYSLTVSISSLDKEIKEQLESSIRTLKFTAK